MGVGRGQRTQWSATFSPSSACVQVERGSEDEEAIEEDEAIVGDLVLDVLGRALEAKSSRYAFSAGVGIASVGEPHADAILRGRCDL